MRASQDKTALRFGPLFAAVTDSADKAKASGAPGGAAPAGQKALQKPRDAQAQPRSQTTDDAARAARAPAPEDGALTEEFQNTERRSPGRPRGRRSDGTYTQTGAYIPVDLYRDVKIAILQDARKDLDGKDEDFSGLVERLLTEYLAVRAKDRLSS